MMFSNVAFWVFVICAVALVIGTVWLIKSYRDAKHASYFFLREEAALRVKRLMFVLVPLAVVVVFLGLRLFGPEEEVPPGPEETPTIVETSTLAPTTPATDTPTPEPTGTITATVVVPTEETEVRLAATLTPTGTAVITGTPVLTLPATSPVSPTVTGTSVPVSATVTSAAATGVITGTVEPSLTGVITGTVEPSLTAAVTGTVEPSLTGVVTGTVEPSPTPTATDTPVFSTVTPDPDTTVESIIFGLAATSDNRPKNPLRVFPPGDDHIYAFFEYHDMKNGVAWRHVWFKESKELASEGGLWEWGTDGRAYVFFSPVGGFTPGRYMVQLYIGGELRQSGTFVVR